MSASQQRRYQAALVPTKAVPAPFREGERDRETLRRRTTGRKAARRRRVFAVMVVVPVLLMLGSVYLHTVSAELVDRMAVLEEQLARAESEGERLEVRVAELSGAERIRGLAAEKLGMQDPASSDMKVYGGTREDGRQHGGEEKGGVSR